jgi:two-component system NarL family sensor kinase
MTGCNCISERYLEQSPACHWVIDRDLRFTAVYGDSEPIFGVAVARLLEQRIEEALSPDLARLWRDRAIRVFSGESLLLRDRRGSHSWNLAVFPLRDGEDEIAYCAGLALDSTPWSTADQELRYTVLGALRAQEFERNTMSRFLHDTVGQNLSATGLHLDLIRMDLETTAPAVCEHIVEIQRMLEGMMQKIREYSYELNPALVERAGLHSALDRLAGRFRQRFTGALRLHVDPSIKVASPVGSALYKIAEEAIENALQHAGCSQIEIAVKSTKNGPRLEVRDNGRGFDPAEVFQGRRGLGLLTMEHLAAEAGLGVSISSTRGSGTLVSVATPGGIAP